MTSSQTTDGTSRAGGGAAGAPGGDERPPGRPAPARLPDPGPAVGDPQAALLALRRFCRGQAEGDRAGLSPDLLPALLHPLRGAARARTDYPLWLSPAGGAVDGRTVLPLADLLASAIGTFAPRPEEARLLRDNLLRLERIVRARVPADAAPVPAAPVLAAAAAELKTALALRGENAERLDAELRQLVESLPEGGSFLGFQADAAVALLVHAARERRAAGRSALRAEVEARAGRLRGLLAVERTKEDTARAPEAVQGSMGAGGEWIDAGRMSDVLGARRGSLAMDAARRERIEATLAVLDAWLAEPGGPAAVLVAVPGDDPPAVGDDVEIVTADDPCGDAVRRWRELADRLVPVARALRQAALDADDRYEPARHDPWLQHMGRDVLGPAEIASLPAVAAIDRAGRVPGRLASFSALLLSRTPVLALVDDPPIADPGAPGGDPLFGARLELGYLAVSHREAFVQQSSPARPSHLVAGFRAALEAGRPSVHLLAGGLGDPGPGLGAWVETGAAIEGRAHPLFRYDPTAGSTWASRLDFSGNPAPDADWPVGALPVLGPEGDGDERTLGLPFTFADYALLSPVLRAHFSPVPAVGDAEDLVPLADALGESGAEAGTRVPFVWACGEDGRLVRLAVSARLFEATRDRLRWWRTLQELAGVRNEYVLEATARARAEAEAAWAAERTRLEAEHAETVERVRAEAAGEAMAGLARTLLDLDPGEALASRPAGAPRAASAPAPAGAAVTEAAEAPAAEAVPEPEEEELLGDAWVDTPLCTSCNDCTNINPKLFVYDGNKQVRIGDPDAGTFAQLVAAAEKCPARCIHPGQPRRADEPGLEALVARAKPFQ